MAQHLLGVTRTPSTVGPASRTVVDFAAGTVDLAVDIVDPEAGTVVAVVVGTGCRSLRPCSEAGVG